MGDSSDSDINQSDLIDTDQTATNDRLVSELIILSLPSQRSPKRNFHNLTCELIEKRRYYLYSRNFCKREGGKW